MQKANFPFKAVPQNHWSLPSSAHKCVLCSKNFGLFQVAENCRGCGRVCCVSCLANHLVLPGQPGTAPVPVCPLCTKSITRTHEEAEMAMERCQLLEEILNEQAIQGEKMRSDLREQQEENKLLHHEKERLKATIARMEIEAEVAAAKAKAEAAAAVPAVPPAFGTSPSSFPSKPDSETSALTDGAASAAAITEKSLAAAEERLNKKKRQLDMREATLKDALKKVSADAAKNADQRAAMQEQERQLTALVTSKFTALFEEERQRLEDLCMEAVTSVQSQYGAWVGQQQDAALERRKKFEQTMEDRQQRAAAELTEVRASRDALHRQLESQRELIAHLEAAAAAETAKATVAAAVQTQQTQQQSNWEEERRELEYAVAAASRRAEMAEDDLLRLQSEVAATTAQYTEEAQARETALAAYEAEQQQMQQRLETCVKSFRAQQAEAAAETEASVTAAVEVAHRKAEAAQSEALAAQQQRLSLEAAAEMKAAVQRAAEQHAAALQALEERHAAKIKALEDAILDAQRLSRKQESHQQQMQQQQQQHREVPHADASSSATVSIIIEEPAVATDASAAEAAAAEQYAELLALHEEKQAQWETKSAQLEAALQEAQQQVDDARRSSAEASEAASAAHAAAMANLEARHKKEKTDWEKKAREHKRAHVQQEEGPQSQDKAAKEEKAALQKTVKDLEARLEARKTASWQLQQQLRDCKQQLTDLQAQSQKKTAEEEAATAAAARAATAMQRSAATLVKEVQQAQQRLAAEHAAALTQLRTGLQDAARAAATTATSAREKKARDVARQLQAKVASLTQGGEATQQLLMSEQERRSAAEARVEKLTAALCALQSTEQQQRQVMLQLQEAHRSVLEELETVRAEAAVQASMAAAAAVAAATPARGTSLERSLHLLEVQQCWVEQQSRLESFYTVALYAVLQREWSAAMDSTVSHIAAENERQRQLRARNAKALENTTSTIKEVQEDLRARAQALVERQAALEERERRVVEKRQRIDVVCRNLYTVAMALGQKHRDDSECAEVEEVVRSARVMGEGA